MLRDPRGSRFTVQAYVIAQRAPPVSPAVIYTNSVSATEHASTLAKKLGRGGPSDKTFTVQYAKDPNNPTWNNDNTMKTYKQVMAKYHPKDGSPTRYAWPWRTRSMYKAEATRRRG